MGKSDKFLVSLVQSLTHRQIFFLVWLAIVGVFVALMVAHYRKRTQRNFRNDGLGKRGQPFTKSSLPQQPPTDNSLKKPKMLGK